MKQGRGRLSETDDPHKIGGGKSEEELVMSEIHLGCPPNHSGSLISRFTVALPEMEASQDDLSPMGQDLYEVDEDGDLIVTRRRNSLKDYFVITIEHHITSSIPMVGLQIWRAELVLADFVMHTLCTSSKFNGIVAVELGAGTGLTGMLLARAAKTVFITDHGEEVLGNCVKNVQLNAGILHHKASIFVRELDWDHPWPPQVKGNLSVQKRFKGLYCIIQHLLANFSHHCLCNLHEEPFFVSYGWSISEIEELKKASLIVAADVIYSDDLTDAFFNTLQVLMSAGEEKVLYLALEKRYNFTMDDLDVVANGYSHFLSHLKIEEDDCFQAECTFSFVGRRINPIEIPQYVQEYERGDDVEIWQIKYLERKL